MSIEPRECPDKGMEYIDLGDGVKRYLASIPSGGKMKAELPGYAASNMPMFDRKDWFEVSRRGRGTVFDTIFNQGNHGSCVGNGWAGALMRVRVLSGAKPVVLSPAFTYSLINGNRDNGANISDGIAALQKYGTCLFATVGQDPIYQSRMPSAAKSEALNYRLGAAYHCSTWDEVISAVLSENFLPVYGYQVGRNFMRADKYGVAGHDRGQGNHCVLPSALIAGPEMRTADAVAVGDTVFGHDGKPHKVTHVFRRHYSGSMVRIGGPGSLRIEVTEEHPVLVYRWSQVKAGAVIGAVNGSPNIPETRFKDRRYESHWVKAKNVRPGDYLVTPKLSLRPTEPTPFTMSPTAAWLLGRYAGDGNLIGSKGMSISVEAGGRGLRDVYQAFVKMGFRPIVTKRWTNGELSGTGRPTSYKVHVYSTTLAALFERWFGRGSSNKRLPLHLFSDARAQDALAGLLSADGHRDAVNLNRRVFNSTSLMMAQQVRLLLIAAGERPTFQAIKADRPGAFPNAKPSWRVCWTEGGKQGSSRFARDVLITPVRTVLFTPYSGEVFNFEVADVNSYLADTIATHNCNHADGVKLLPDGRWVLDDVNSWDKSFMDGGRCYIDEQHLFANGDQADVCVVQGFVEAAGEPNTPPVFQG